MGYGLRFLFLFLCFLSSYPANVIGAAAGSAESIRVPGGIREVPILPNYTAPTENLTKVANAVTFETYSLSTLIRVRSGLGVTKPVSVTVRYSSYNGRAFSDAVWGTYNNGGLQLVVNDQEGIGTPRQADLRVELFEPDDPAAVGRRVGTGYTIPNNFRLNLDPLYDVGARPIQVARIQDCPMLTSSDVVARWFSPDNQQHEASFRFGLNKVALVPGSQWSAQALSASSSYHVPNVGLYGFHIPSAPSNVNLIPAPLVAGTPMAAQEIKFQMNEPNRHCAVQVQYVIDRKIRRYVDPSSPAGLVVPQSGAIAR
ncbi:MAG TPA: hypothetical protein VIB79_13185 [Candidatus Binatia bacterium]|jgi:hypothetical protein